MRASVPLSLAALALLVSHAVAQPSYPPRYIWGIDAMLDYSYHTAFTPTSYGDNPSASHGSGLGFMAGLALERRFRWSENSLLLALHAGYEALPASFESVATSSNGVGPHGEATPVSGRHTADVGYGMVRADLQLRLPLTWVDHLGELELHAGPSVGYIVRKKWEQSFAIDPAASGVILRGDAGYPLRDAGRSVLLEEGTIRDAEPWRVGIRAGFSLWLTSYDITYVPSITFDYALTPVVKGSAWKAHAIEFGVEVLPGEWIANKLHPRDENEDTPLSN
jgi:hypothetical protein